MSKKILIVGATSAIAAACARLWAVQSAEFFLVARDLEKLQQTADDLRIRGAAATTMFQLDLNRLDEHEAMFTACQAALGGIDICLIAHGTLPDQAACEADPALALREFSSNGLSVIALLTPLANLMQAQGNGSIAVISSVAGDRGRPSNYLYGSAKASVTAFCEGLSARLHRSGVHVLTVKPGFVATPMTRGLSLPALLLATPERVATDILRAIERGAVTLYTPWFWWFIMFAIRLVPAHIFRRLRL
jgi:decaprenylphospho-beta-D-erythro-pentofuranosid-2-ulose 2-reductase